MKTEPEIRKMLDDRLQERKTIHANKNKIGNKGYRLPSLAIECGLLIDILGDRL